jgi:hypothetical protein
MPKTASPRLFDPAQADNVRPYLERVLNSDAFRKAPNLRHLLEYLVTKSNEGLTDQLKESVLAIEVFGRRTDFDGRIDNIVRVQAHRLRKLLETYYAEEGKDDKLRVTVPRGGYVPQFLVVEEQESLPASTAMAAPYALKIAAPETDAPPRAAARRFPFAKGAAFAGVFLAGALLSMLLMLPERAPRPDPAIAEIWRGVFEPNAKVIVSYTNPAFLRVGRSRTYLLYQGSLSAPPGTEINIAESDPGIDRQYGTPGQPLFFSDGWTGTGEVLGVNRLTELGAQFKKSIAVIPSRALALDDVRSANVIFLGSPWFNGVLAQIGNDTTPMYNTNDGRIVVRDPQNGEQAVYENGKDPATSQIKSGYALFSVLPGLDASRRVVSSAGLSTWSTWSGIDFLTTPPGAAQIARALKAANGGKIPRFYQAVIRTEIIKGAVSNESLAATRVVQPRGSVRR